MTNSNVNTGLLARAGPVFQGVQSQSFLWRPQGLAPGWAWHQPEGDADPDLAHSGLQKRGNHEGGGRPWARRGGDSASRAGACVSIHAGRAGGCRSGWLPCPHSSRCLQGAQSELGWPHPTLTHQGPLCPKLIPGLKSTWSETQPCVFWSAVGKSEASLPTRVCSSRSWAAQGRGPLCRGEEPHK